MYNQKTYTVDNSVEVRDLSGAGDTWMSSFVVKYLDTKIVDTAIEFANQNATRVVEQGPLGITECVWPSLRTVVISNAHQPVLCHIAGVHQGCTTTQPGKPRRAAT